MLPSQRGAQPTIGRRAVVSSLGLCACLQITKKLRSRSCSCCLEMFLSVANKISCQRGERNDAFQNAKETLGIDNRVSLAPILKTLLNEP